MANSLDLNPQLVRIKLPFSVIQLWNDLEIGQVVKLPATNNVEDPVTILAHRDGEETMCLEFTKPSEAIVSDGFASEVIIVRIEQTFIDSASQTRASPTAVANHKPCDNATNKKLSKKLANKKQVETKSRKKVKEENNQEQLDLECEESSDGHEEVEQVRNGTKGAGSMKLPVVISPTTSSSNGSVEQEKKGKSVSKRRASDEGSFSSGDDPPTPKRSRGEKKYDCNLCGAIFIYFTSYTKHMKRHGGPAAAAALAAAEGKTPAAPQKLQKILPKPAEHQHQHHMVTRRNASLSSPPVTKNDSKSSPLAVGLPPTHLILPRPISPGPTVTIFQTTTPLIVPKVAPPQASTSTVSVAVLPSIVSAPTPMVASHKPPPHVQVQRDGTHLLRSDDPLDCWVCLRQFKYPTSFLKHMRIEHELIVKVEEHGDRRRRSNVVRKPSVHILNTPETMTSDSLNNNQTDEQDDFRGHQSGQVVALQMRPNRDYVVVDSDLNEIVLGEYLLCSICLTSFSFKMEYIKHMSRSHGVIVKDMTEDVASPPSTKVDTQVFQCHVCNKKFFYRIPYEQHLKQIHNISMVVMDGSQQTPNESYICRLCTMVFLYKTSFEKHMQREHGVDMSNEGYTDPNGASNSRKSSSPSVDNMMFRCNLCLAWFKDSVDLDDHIISQHPNHSGGKFGNNTKSDSKDPEPDRVKDPDTKLSLIQCDYCSKTFKFRIAYTKHLRNAHQDKAEDSNNDSQTSKPDIGYQTTKSNQELNKGRIITTIKVEPVELNSEKDMHSTENSNGIDTDDKCQEKLKSKDDTSQSEELDITLPQDLSMKDNTSQSTDLHQTLPQDLSMKDKKTHEGELVGESTEESSESRDKSQSVENESGKNYRKCRSEEETKEGPSDATNDHHHDHGNKCRERIRSTATMKSNDVCENTNSESPSEMRNESRNDASTVSVQDDLKESTSLETLAEQPKGECNKKIRSSEEKKESESESKTECTSESKSESKIDTSPSEGESNCQSKSKVEIGSKHEKEEEIVGQNESDSKNKSKSVPECESKMENENICNNQGVSENVSGNKNESRNESKSGNKNESRKEMSDKSENNNMNSVNEYAESTKLQLESK